MQLSSYQVINLFCFVIFVLYNCKGSSMLDNNQETNHQNMKKDSFILSDIHLLNYGVKHGQDISIALQQAINDAAQTGQQLVLPSGVFAISQPIVFPSNMRTTIRGQGPRKTMLLYNGNPIDVLFSLEDQGADNLIIENIGFNGNKRVKIAFKLFQSDNSTWQNLEFTEFTQAAFSINYSINNTFYRCYFIKNYAGIEFSGKECNVTNINNCTFVHQDYGLIDKSYSHKTINFRGCTFEGLSRAAILLNHVFGVNITGCYFEANSNIGHKFNATQSENYSSLAPKAYIIFNASGQTGESYHGINYFNGGINISGNFISNPTSDYGETFIHAASLRATSIRANYLLSPTMHLISIVDDRMMSEINDVVMEANGGFIDEILFLEGHPDKTSAGGLERLKTSKSISYSVEPITNWTFTNNIALNINPTTEKIYNHRVYEIDTKGGDIGDFAFKIDLDKEKKLRNKSGVFAIWVKKGDQNKNNATFTTIFNNGSKTKHGYIIKAEMLRTDWKKYTVTVKFPSSGICMLGIRTTNLAFGDKIMLAQPTLEIF